MKKFAIATLVLLSQSTLVFAQTEFKVNAVDGNGESKSINVKVSYEEDNKKEIDQKRVNLLVDKTSKRIKAELKNEYSYVPRSATINQQGVAFMVKMRYTAKNSYGADVVNTTDQIFVMKDDGSF